MSNPYAAPDAALSDITEDETYDPQIFAVEGRIGRLRYLTYSWLIMIVLMFVIGIIAAILVPTLARNNPGAVAGAMLLVYIPIIAVSIIMAKRRFNDLNKSGWFTLLLIVPFVNIFAGLYLTFWPGTKGTNEFGPRPAKNPVILYIAALIVPVIIIGILAAVAIPAYQQYVMRAKAAQMNQNR
jgi:uncharacterized membrane protein YhaH (DUF805 family)